MSSASNYYVPEQSKWPIIGSIGLFLMMFGAGTMLIGMREGQESIGHWVFFAGSLIMAYMLFGWFSNVIKESRQGLYSEQMDRSFRWGMSWFIFSEIMFFAAFFGALFYVRYFTGPWLGGEGAKAASHMLWPDFVFNWPSTTNPDPEAYIAPKKVVEPFGIPLLNTALLLTSSLTSWLAHHALKKDNRGQLIFWLATTVVLGGVFMYYQVIEYIHAYEDLGLTLNSGIYGSTFFLLTGFHGAHVTLGAIMLAIMLIRIIKGHFTPEHHFGFEAASWYWHFVDVVWVCLFIFVYIV